MTEKDAGGTDIILLKENQILFLNKNLFWIKLWKLIKI
jgi:hypothetical protein